MSPDPIVRVQAFLMLLALIAAGLLGAWHVVLIATLVTATEWAVLRRQYVARRRKWHAPSDRAGVRSREPLDRLMDRWAVATIAAGAFGVVLAVTVGYDGSQRIAATSAAIAILFVAGGMYWSSLIDWFWVTPRVSGLLGHRSCRPQPDDGASSVSWESVTRWWLVHRAVSAILVSLGVAGLLATLAGVIAAVFEADPAAQAMLATLVLIIAAAMQIYRRHVARAWQLILHPETRVGMAFEDRDVGACWPVDVALEGMKVVRLSEHERRRQAALVGSAPRFYSEKGDTTIPLDEVQTRRRAVGNFSCRGTCTGINWYCIENPDAWFKSVGDAQRRGVLADPAVGDTERPPPVG
ncbi:MAG: hypothetical protein M3320_03555 [Actinomycetota bacterium]|nr:hypothetical protein [Actinomycetota bacterium]MDQ5807732.1 hypothetical protein [Actinomycetota bacterium]